MRSLRFFFRSLAVLSLVAAPLAHADRGMPGNFGGPGFGGPGGGQGGWDRGRGGDWRDGRGGGDWRDGRGGWRDGRGGGDWRDGRDGRDSRDGRDGRGPGGPGYGGPGGPGGPGYGGPGYGGPGYGGPAPGPVGPGYGGGPGYIPHQLIPVFRSFTGYSHFFSLDPNEGNRAGFRFEGPAFLTSANGGPNLAPLYRCFTGGEHFLSRDAYCEGQRTEGTLGNVALNPMPDMPSQLVRCFNGQAHLATKNVQECYNAGYRVEGPLGFVQ